MSENNNTLDGIEERAIEFCKSKEVSPVDANFYAEFATAETATLTARCEGLEAALRTIRDHYRLRNLECKYCGDAATIAAKALDA